MSSSVHECDVCNENYDEDERKPIVLQCGHSFCRKCLLSVESAGNKKCPKCRQPIVLPVDQLPVNYALIPSEEHPAAGTSHAASSDKCSMHGFDLDNFCATCGVLICMKCVVKSHLQHRVVAEEDLFNEDELPKDFVMNLQSKMATNLGCLVKSLVAVDKIRDYIRKLVLCGEDIQQSEDVLRSMRTSLLDDMQAWKTTGPKSAAEKRALFKMLPQQWKNDVQTLSNDLVSEVVRNQVNKLQETSKNMQKLVSTTSSAPSSSDIFADAQAVDLLADNNHWRVSTNEDVQRALASVTHGRRSSSLKIVSASTEPIRKLPEVLNILGGSCLGAIQIRDLNSFWGTPSESLHQFIEKHGHKVTEFYGSFDDISAMVRVKGKSTSKLGVGVTSLKNIHEISEWDVKPTSISFNGSLSLDQTSRKPLSWRPRCLHFPDLKNEDQRCVNPLLDEFFTAQIWLGRSLYLPRCGLSEQSLLSLMNNCKESLRIFCHDTSLTTEIRLRLTAAGREKNINFFWNIDQANM